MSDEPSNRSGFLLIAMVSASTGAVMVAAGALGAYLARSGTGALIGAGIGALFAPPIGIAITGKLSQVVRSPKRIVAATLGGWLGIAATMAASQTPVGRVLSVVLILLPGMGALAGDVFARAKLE